MNKKDFNLVEISKEVIPNVLDSIYSKIKTIVAASLGITYGSFGSIVLSDSFRKEISDTDQFIKAKEKLKAEILKDFEVKMPAKMINEIKCDLRRSVESSVRRELSDILVSELTEQTVKIILEDPSLQPLFIANKFIEANKN